MGQKVSPHGLRVGIIKDWGSKWYADKNNFADYLIEDNKVREFVKKKLYAAGVSKVVIERPEENKIKIIIATGRPGMVIGRSGDGIEQLKADLVKLTGKTVDIDIREVRRAELDAQLTAESIAQALERRIAFRRAMKQAIGRTMKANAKGIKVLVSGRLGGAEIARSESYSEGNVPLHTLRADIDYGFAEADTTYGKIGVKVWINHGEILDKGLQSIVREEKNEGRKNDRRKGGRRRDGERRPRRNPRENRAELPKAVNPRVRNTPKEEPKAQEPEVEAPQVENEAVETATEE
ncbi:MAG TPA: 30S ribosomal protein S3 [Candidatus Eubacterium pullicola]|uniref:Small ribosomal subunit protein uS3 n=1 Tax=Gallibacter intestinalis TaxID=2779356 RepID=A0ABR9QYY6_9FIRM|nr:30S ribosomal protein S3 [Gallibacter intestinalis]MBE5036069.1 30S ribosomal protein S3 [Gallibacter intestinalis]HIW39360.1 30S ribosomal protein S3 [Candidatus Eubacterium pullicola]